LLIAVVIAADAVSALDAVVMSFADRPSEIATSDSRSKVRLSSAATAPVPTLKVNCVVDEPAMVAA